jgi:hypothetical protein
MKQEDIGQTIKEMSEIEFPEGLHGKILRQIVFLRFRTPFITVVSLLLLNLVISGWRIWEQLLEAETFAMTGLLWDSVELSFGGFFQFILDIVEIAPVGHILLLVLNLAVLGYVAIYVPRLFAKTKHATVA